MSDQLNAGHNAEEAEAFRASMDFSTLGGRIKPDGSYPTPEEWLASYARPKDMVFDDDHEVRAFFSEPIKEIEQIVQSSDITRETMISRLLILGDKRLDLISNLELDYLPPGMRGDTYAPESVYDDNKFAKRYTF